MIGKSTSARSPERRGGPESGDGDGAHMLPVRVEERGHGTSTLGAVGVGRPSS